MNKDIPLPMPYPFYNISSKYRTKIEAKVNYNINNSPFTVPIYEIGPYIPDTTYPRAVQNATMKLNNFSAASYSILSYSIDGLYSIILELAKNSTIIDDVIKGEIPNSINVPLLLANIFLIK